MKKSFAFFAIALCVLAAWSAETVLAQRISDETMPELLAGQSLSSLQTEFPDIFVRPKPEKHEYEPATYELAGPLLTHTTIQYSYGPDSNSMLSTKSEKIIPLQFPVEDRKTLYVHDRIKVQQQAGLVSMVSGQKLDDQQSYNHYKQQQLRLYNLQGRLLNQHTLSFDFPLEVRLHEFVKNEDGVEAGIAYVFGAARRYGQQLTVPDPADYELFYLDREGREQFRHRYQYGSACTASEPFYATAVRDQLLILGKGIGKKPDFHLLIFDKDSLLRATRIDQSVFYENIVGDYSLSLEQSYASQYLVADSKVLEDGSIIFLGEHRTLVEGANWSFRTNKQSKTGYNYKAYVLLHFSQEGDLIANYVLERGRESLVDHPAAIRLLAADTGSLHLVFSEPRPAQKRAETSLRTTEKSPAADKFAGSADGRRLLKNYPDRQLAPVVVSIGLDARKLNILRFPDSFLSLDEWRLLHDPKTKELLLVGTSPNKLASQKLIIKKIRL